MSLCYIARMPLDTLLDFFFPRTCLGCARLGTFLCLSCLDRIPLRASQPCPGCGQAALQGKVCRNCQDQWTLDALWAISSYQKSSLLSKAIQTLKYKHTEALANILGDWMTDHFSLDVSGFELVPVPLHPARERTRGYNQARRLAESLSRRRAIPLCEGLQRWRATPPQAHEGKIERLKNLRDAFAVDSPSPFLNKKIVLIDDVCSTGSTLNEAAKVLKSAGCVWVMGLVLARA